MSYGTRINQNIQTNDQQNLGYSNQGIDYGNIRKGSLYPTRQLDLSQNVGTTNQGINNYGKNNRKGSFYKNRANNLLAQYDTDSYDEQTYQNGYSYQPYYGTVNRQGSADYPNYSDYSDVTLIRSPNLGGGNKSPCSGLGSVLNPLFGLLILGMGFFLTWTNWTKLQALKAEGRYFSLNSVEHLLEFIWNG